MISLHACVKMPFGAGKKQCVVLMASAFVSIVSTY